MARGEALTDLSDVELFDRLDQAKDEATNLRFQHVTGQLDNPNLLAESRRQVARLLTELRAREIHAAELTMEREALETSEPGTVDDSSGAKPGVFKRRRRR